MTTPQLIKVLHVHNELGEGVIWDARRGAVWWTDIQKSQLYRYRIESEQLEQWTTPQRLCCFAPVAGKDHLIAAFDTGFAWYDPTTDDLEWIQAIDEGNPNTRLNDGRADRQGRFWAGSMVEGDSSAGMGTLYCLNKSLQCTATIGGLSISNGLCWSPDSRYMYHTDTPSRRIDRYLFNRETGELGERNTFAVTSEGCYPDGSTVDAEECVWNAQWGASQVVRYATSGEIDMVLSLPVSQPTCAAFGGPDLNLLFVTTARQDLTVTELEAQPDAGNLFIYQTQFSGIPDPEFEPSVAE